MTLLDQIRTAPTEDALTQLGVEVARLKSTLSPAELQELVKAGKERREVLHEAARIEAELRRQRAAELVAKLRGAPLEHVEAVYLDALKAPLLSEQEEQAIHAAYEARKEFAP